MNNPNFAPGTSKDDVQNINTPEGRKMLFNEKIDALTKPRSEGGKGMTLDDAIFEMRGNKEDRLLLEAMGMGSHSQEHQKLLDRISGQRAIKPGSDDLVGDKSLLKPIVADVARNSRLVAFNARLEELTRKGLGVDQAINAMRANAQDAALLAAMDGPIA